VAPDIAEIQMPPLPTGGAVDSLRIQSEMIWYICVRLGEDHLSKYADGERVRLKDIFKQAQEKYYPISE
jgi:hypothetical protein